MPAFGRSRNLGRVNQWKSQLRPRRRSLLSDWPSYRLVVLGDSSPAGFWILNYQDPSGGGDFRYLDYSGNGRNSSFVGSSLTPTKELSGLNRDLDFAARFDGTNDYGEVADNAAWDSGTMSVEAVFRCTSNTVLLGRWNNPDAFTNASFYLQVAQSLGLIRFRGFTGNSYTDSDWSNSTAYDGTWHHLVVTTNGSNVIAYLDGVSLGSLTAGGSINSSNRLLTIACLQNTNAGSGFYAYSNANIAAISYYPGTVLTAAQVAAHAAAVV